ncbi:DUF6314 family protein [Labrys okinawensis]|uniref:DUF6314 family protein n=1 Tax=Labrys okinawensis TaxID=346911 RepID=UPI0039BC2721
MWLRHAMLPALDGRWSLDRSVDDIASGKPMAAMQGTATFTLGTAGEAIYAEHATLALEGGPAMPATRHYFYRQEEDGLAIFFDEACSQLFHRLILEEGESGLVGADLHLCAPDRYDSRYEFRSDGSFAVVHVVEGPRKSYVSRTSYLR